MRAVIWTGDVSFVARSDRLHVSRPAPLTMPNVLVMLDFAVVTFSLFEARTARPLASRQGRQIQVARRYGFA